MTIAMFPPDRLKTAEQVAAEKPAQFVSELRLGESGFVPADALKVNHAGHAWVQRGAKLVLATAPGPKVLITLDSIDNGRKLLRADLAGAPGYFWTPGQVDHRDHLIVAAFGAAVPSPAAAP